MATNQNAINAPLPLEVKNGGTGAATVTAYAPFCAGTTSTGVWQQANTGRSTDQNVLTSTGNASLPTFQTTPAGGLTFITSSYAAGTATLDFVSVFSATYDNYLITYNDCTTGTAGQAVVMRTGTSAPTWHTTGYVGTTAQLIGNAINTTTATTYVNLTDAGQSSTYPDCGTIMVANFNSTNYFTFSIQTCSYSNGVAARIPNWGGAARTAGSASEVSVRFLATSGVMYGTFSIYGIKN